MITNLNRELWKHLDLKVSSGATLARDGATWLKLFIRAADGFADPPPDFQHDLNVTLAQVPHTVQVIRRWSFVEERWIYLLNDVATGAFLAEGRAATEAEAAANALCELLTRRAVTT